MNTNFPFLSRNKETITETQKPIENRRKKSIDDFDLLFRLSSQLVNRNWHTSLANSHEMKKNIMFVKYYATIDRPMGLAAIESAFNARNLQTKNEHTENGKITLKTEWYFGSSTVVALFSRALVFEIE